MIDSQKVSTPNGTQLSQRKELEVLQARTTSGSLQVVRSSTIQTSSSRRSILSMGGNNDTNSTVSNDNRSLANISSLIVRLFQRLTTKKIVFHLLLFLE